MNDDEINRRVAEIEGWVAHYQSIAKPGQFDWVRNNPRQSHVGDPPYATDWAWCGPLVEKYKLDLAWSGMAWLSNYTVRADTPQRAICLAVIAAHGDGK